MTKWKLEYSCYLRMIPLDRIEEIPDLRKIKEILEKGEKDAIKKIREMGDFWITNNVRNHYGV